MKKSWRSCGSSDLIRIPEEAGAFPLMTAFLGKGLAIEKHFGIGHVHGIGIDRLRLGSAEADARLETFFRRYLDEYFQQQPSEATVLGRPSFRCTARRPFRPVAGQVDRADAAGVGRPSAGGRLRPAVAGRPGGFRDLPARTRKEPLVEREHAAVRGGSPPVHRLFQRQRLCPPHPVDVAQGNQSPNAIARMRQIPRVVAAARQTIAAPPRSVLETAIAQNRGSIAFYEKEIFDWPATRRKRTPCRRPLRKLSPA